MWEKEPERKTGEGNLVLKRQFKCFITVEQRVQPQEQITENYNSC